MVELHDAVYVDGVRLPIGRAGDTGYYAATRADDMVVRTIRALLDRNPQLDPAA
ncbi:MAG: acetyl-CoA C-acyltransferase, partial [Actinomycetota bacterium]|nr:acetyl-CoA C-acyltransferase [Actinomycetota bacterium]